MIITRSCCPYRAISALLLVITLLFLRTLNADDTKPTSFFSASEQQKILLHGPWPTITPPDPGNELSGLAWAEQLGSRLFNDTQLSGDQTLSCATCHVPAFGFTDQRPVSQGKAEHTRNTQGLLNVGLQRWFGRDGGADSLWAATLRPMLAAIEMDANIPTTASRLRNDRAFTESMQSFLESTGQSNISDEALVVLAAKSIAAFLRTLSSEPTDFDRYRDALANSDSSAMARYPEDAKRGLEIFIGDANCQLCHFGPNFSNQEFHDIGRPFFTGIGVVDPGRYMGIQRARKDPYGLTGIYNGTNIAEEIRKTERVKLSQVNWGQWRTPSLRNLTLTSPYTHDGSLTTLQEVVDAYADIDPTRLHSKGEALLKPINLSQSQRNDLVAFLKTLSH